MKQLPIMNGSLSRTERSPQKKSRPVVLIGFQQHGNLGIGYLASTLRQNGYEVEVIDYQIDPDLILERVKFLDPILVGFSLIFQFYITQFSTVIDRLREGGVDCHF